MCNNNGCLSNISNTITVLNGSFSTSAEAITTTATTQSGICYTGNAITLSYPYRAGTTYQWLKDEAAISGANNATYSATAVGKYKVQITEGSCSFTSPYFYIKPVPSLPSVSSISIQANTYGTLTATGCTGGQINWYDALSGGSKLAMFTHSFNSPILSGTTTYYADCQILGCSSNRVPGIVNVSTPCSQNLTIASSTLPPFQASEYITISGTINYTTGNRTYKAGKAITITSPTGGNGFWQTENGTVFEAKIEGCQ
jgi:Ig-like domain CHU_C associated